MIRFCSSFIPILLSFNILLGQSIKVTCSEKEIKDGEYPTLVNTCIIKNFKFIKVSYPDGVGRYFDSEHNVYIRVNNKYFKTVNSRLFNKNQAKLVSIINEHIQEDFKKNLSDSAVKDCLAGLDSIPKYKMNDFEISFWKDEIWFEVHWGLVSACRSVDGTIVSLKITEIENT